jgi:hypothetical protein
MTPEEIYQRMTAALEQFKGHRIDKTTELRIHNAIMDILVEACPVDDIRRWIKIEPRMEADTNVIGIHLFSHPEPPLPVAQFIQAMRGHGFQITSDFRRFDDAN